LRFNQEKAAMQTLAELERALMEKRALAGWYGMRGDEEMARHLRYECYWLFCDVEVARRAIIGPTAT
jgi:hypothetical protein